MTFLFFLMGLLPLIYWISATWKFSKRSGYAFYFLPVMFIKVLAGISFGLVYHYYYAEGDTIAFHHAAVRLSDLFYEDFSEYLKALIYPGEFSYFNEPRSDFFVRLISPVYLIAFSDYWLVTILLSVVSFLCVWHFVTRFTSLLDIDFRTALICFLLLPSVIFWSSGIVKETFSLIFQSIILWSAIPFVQKKKLRVGELLLGVISFWLLYQIKYYHAVVLILILIPTSLYAMILANLKSPLVRALSLVTCVIALVLVTSTMHYNLKLSRIAQVIVDNHHDIVSKSGPESVFILENFEATIEGYLINFPEAVFSGLFRPLPWESRNFFSLYISVENTLLLLIFLFIIVRGKKWMIRLNAKFIPMIIYILILSTLLAYSIPNFGTLARFKVIFLPFFAVVLLNQIKWFNKKIPSSY